MNSQIELKSSDGLHNYLTMLFPWEIKSPELTVYLENRENNTLTTCAKPCCCMYCICSYLFTDTHMYFGFGSWIKNLSNVKYQYWEAFT